MNKDQKMTEPDKTKPPIMGSWPRLYLFIGGYLVALIAIMYGFMTYFS